MQGLDRLNKWSLPSSAEGLETWREGKRQEKRHAGWVQETGPLHGLQQRNSSQKARPFLLLGGKTLVIHVYPNYAEPVGTSLLSCLLGGWHYDGLLGLPLQDGPVA